MSNSSTPGNDDGGHEPWVKLIWIWSIVGVMLLLGLVLGFVNSSCRGGLLSRFLERFQGDDGDEERGGGSGGAYRSHHPRDSLNSDTPREGRQHLLSSPRDS